jgi:hypothetical protein
MRVTKPDRVTRSYTQHLVAEPSTVFPLLCPVREADWIDGWDPRLVLSHSGVAEPDCVFVTEAGQSDAIWYVTRHEPHNGFVEIIKITPALTACRVTIKLRPAAGGSEAVIRYAHTSLGPEGDALVASFTQDHYERLMQEWETRMNHYLSHGTNLRAVEEG